MVLKNYEVNKGSSRRSDQLLAVTNPKNTIAEETFIPFLLTRKVLAVVGILPCVLESPYWPSFDLRRSSCVYGCFIYSLFTCNFVLSAMQKKEDHDQLDPEDSVGRMICIECFAFSLPHAIGGALLFFDTAAVESTCRAFTELQELFSLKIPGATMVLDNCAAGAYFYQDLRHYILCLMINYKKATGRSLENRRKLLERSMNSFGIIAPPVIYIIVIITVPRMLQEHFVGACLIYANTVGVMVLFLWLNITFGVLDATNDAKAEFTQALTNGNLNYSMVYNFRLLWISMRAVLKSMGSWLSAMIEYYIYMCLIILFFFEGSMTMKSKGGDTTTAISHFIGCAVFTTFFSIFFIANHWVEKKMKFLVSDVLATVPLSTFDIKVQREVLMLFVVEGAQPAVTTFGGVLVINKHLTLSLVASVTSYVIVLVQTFSANN